jgi:cytochrome c-type biogenesis protein CcmH
LIYFLIIMLAVLTLAPLAWVVWRGAGVRGRRDAAMALHQAQLGELDRDLSEGRLLPEEQRRLLADAALSEAAPPPPGRLALLLTVVAVPAVAMVLYLEGGHPDYRAEAAAAAASQAGGNADTDKQAAVMVAQLRARLAIMDPASDRAREGYILLGRTELSLGHLPEAADAWGRALDARFDPTLAASTAELMTEAEGHMSEKAAALFRHALAEAPPDVPWRKAVEARLKQAALPLTASPTQ